MCVYYGITLYFIIIIIEIGLTARGQNVDTVYHISHSTVCLLGQLSILHQEILCTFEDDITFSVQQFYRSNTFTQLCT